MKDTKIIAMYLPQFHETEDNNRWWGKGFTDWISVKTAESLFDGHRQPRIPLNENYYDLSDVQVIKSQVNLAREYGIYGFGIYHYWFSSDKQTLTKPAELILENKDVDFPFFLAWDNNSWVRTWSKYTHNTNAWSPRIDSEIDKDTEDTKGVLAKLDYGKEEDWKIHFDYLKKFFSDPRYIKIDNKPLFLIWNYTDKEKLKEMCKYWRLLANQEGYDGIYLMNRFNRYDSLEGFDSLFTYEPMFSAWQNKNIANRVINKLKDQLVKNKDLSFYDYDVVWHSIIDNAHKQASKNIMFGAFVSYDDTPRRGKQGRIILGDSPSRFSRYLGELLEISRKANKEFLFLTAWNEWGEGAYLEPDSQNGLQYLEAVKKACKQ